MKKIISIFTAICIVLTLTGVSAVTISTNDTSKENTNIIAEREINETVKYDTAIYGNAPTYLMEDSFSGGKNAVYGWDTDLRGGGLSGLEWGEFQMVDTSDSECVSMQKHFIPHKSGKVTFESCVRPYEITDGFYYELTGNDKRLFKFMTYRGYLCLDFSNGSYQRLAKYNAGERITVRADIDLDNQNAVIGVNGKTIGEFDFYEQCDRLDGVMISTSKENEMTVALEYFYIYINYIINETFMYGGDGVTPDDWILESDSEYPGIQYDSGMYYPDVWAYVLDDRSSVDSVKLSKEFETQNNDFVYEVAFLIKNNQNGVAFSLGNDKTKTLNIESVDGNLVLNGSDILIKDYRENFWYRLKAEVSPQNGTADFYINYKKVLEDIKFTSGEFNLISFSTDVTRKNEVRIDDVRLYNKIVLPDDYVEAPEVVNAKGGISVGMQHYAMWNEGNHYGWDRINSYADRIPYIGFYNERSPEAADWMIKYEAEHGIDFAVYDWHRPNNGTFNKGVNNPIKTPSRYQALYEGYFNSQYSNYRDFAILFSAISATTLGGYDDWTNNVAPYLVEYFFKDERYKKVNDRPLLFIYDPQAYVDAMGGLELANRGIDYLDELCKKEGMAGVRFMLDGSSTVTADVLNLRGGYAYAYAQVGATYKGEIDNNNRVEQQFENPIRSIAMGWNKNPWQNDSASHYFLTPDEIGSLADLYVDEYMHWGENGIDRDKVLMLTCWDEYGEGHFFNPTRVDGFETLNEIREAVTNEGKREREELPDSLSLARMSSLYEPGRRALMDHQLDFPDRPDVLADVTEDDLYTVAEFDFADPESIKNWKVFQCADDIHWENGAMVFKSTDRDVGVALYGLNIPTDEIVSARVVSDTPDGGIGMLFYQTTEDSNMGTGGKRFNILQQGNGWETNVGFAYNFDKLKGTITGIRWDPVDDNNPGRYFKVKKIEFLGYKMPEEKKKILQEYEELIATKEQYKVTYMGGSTTRVIDPFLKDDVMYVSAWQFLRDAEFKVKYSWTDKTLTAERGGNTLVLTENSDIAKVNGIDVKIAGECYYGGTSWYNYGHFFMPLRSVVEALGGTVNYNDGNNTADVRFPIQSDGFDYLDKPDSTKPMSFMFDTRTEFEDWTPNSHITAMTLKKGMLRLSISGADPQLKTPKLAVNASDYKYLRIRMKNETSAKQAMLLFVTSSNPKWGGNQKYMISITSNDKELKEYIVDLSTAPWNGTITGLRFDPVDPSTLVQGNVYIDSIEFLDEIDDEEM